MIRFIEECAHDAKLPFVRVVANESDPAGPLPDTWLVDFIMPDHRRISLRVDRAMLENPRGTGVLTHELRHHAEQWATTIDWNRYAPPTGSRETVVEERAEGRLAPQFRTVTHGEQRGDGPMDSAAYFTASGTWTPAAELTRRHTIPHFLPPARRQLPEAKGKRWKEIARLINEEENIVDAMALAEDALVELVEMRRRPK